MSRRLIIASAAFIAACSLFTDLSGFDEGAPQVADAGADAVGDATTDASIAPDASPDGCPVANVSSGLLAWYPLDENTGTTITDCSGNGLHGISVGDPPTWTAGHSATSGRALELDGSGCFSIGEAPSLAFGTASRFTVAAWLRPKAFASAGNDARLFFMRRGSGTGWHVATDDPSDVEIEVGTTNAFEVQAGITTNAWIHAAFVYDGALKIYVGGILMKTLNGPIDFTPGESSTARLGCSSPGTSGYVGLVDDLRIYGRALTDAEITTLAQP